MQRRARLAEQEVLAMAKEARTSSRAQPEPTTFESKLEREKAQDEKHKAKKAMAPPEPQVRWMVRRAI